MQMIKTLLAVRLRSVFASLLGKKNDGTKPTATAGRLIGLAVAYVIIVFCLLFAIAVSAIGAAAIMIPAGMDWLYYAIFALFAFSFIFIFSVFETKSELFECKDNELLLSMPISPRHIVLSRIFAVLVYNYLEGLLIYLPVTVVYLAFGGNALSLVGVIISFLCIPLLATALSSGVGYLVALISKRIKRNSFVTVGISLVFLAIYFVGYNAFINGMTALEDPNFDISAAVSASGVFYYIGCAVTMHPIWTPVLVALTAILAYVAYRVISESYISIVSNTGSEKRSVYRAKRLKASGAFTALIKKEMKRFISSATYMLNAGMGIIFTVVIGVAGLIGKSNLALLAAELTEGADWLDPSELMAPVAIALLVMMAGLNMMSSAALSMEGKNLWILKSMPISSRDVIFAKTMPHILISTPPMLVAAVFLIIATDSSPIFWPFFILTPTAANVAFAFFGMVLNTAFPKFDYENEAQPVKQSLPVFVSMMAGTLFGLLILIANLILSTLGLSLLVSALTLLLMLTLAALFGVILNFRSVRKYDSLSI